MIDLAALVLGNADHELGFGFNRQMPALLGILVAVAGPWLLVRAVRRSRRFIDEQVRRQEEEEARLTRGVEGPPRFNG